MLVAMRLRFRRAAALACLALAGCVDPSDRRPGLWLSGTVISGDVADWSFANSHPEIFIETQTAWWIPHSTTIACAADETGLYVAARNPVGKRWVDNAIRNPDVRLEIGDGIYERRLAKIDDPEGIRSAYRAYAAKYGWPESPPADAPEVWYFRVVARRS
jgi:hypothetical protein